MAPYFDQQAGACVLHLERLSRPEQIDVLAGQRVEAERGGAFYRRSRGRTGLADFLDNPQNLIMLWRAVQTGSWPSTRKQLFDLSTALMLQEPNAERARSGAGTFSASQLRPVAGAICAARLISDVEAISLIDQEGTAEIPGYRSTDLFSPELVQPALGRRDLRCGIQPGNGGLRAPHDGRIPCCRVPGFMRPRRPAVRTCGSADGRGGHPHPSCAGFMPGPRCIFPSMSMRGLKPIRMAY